MNTAKRLFRSYFFSILAVIFILIWGHEAYSQDNQITLEDSHISLAYYKPLDGSDTGYEPASMDREPIKEVKEDVIPAQNVQQIPSQPPSNEPVDWVHIILGLIQAVQILTQGFINSKLEKNKELDAENKTLKDKIENLNAQIDTIDKEKIAALQKEVEDLRSKRK
jgi:hypothetical protein